MTKSELAELLTVFSYYLIGGLSLGMVAAAVAVMGGIVLGPRNVGLPVSPGAVTASIVIFIGAFTSFLGFVALLPAELKLIRRRHRSQLLVERMSRRK